MLRSSACFLLLGVAILSDPVNALASYPQTPKGDVVDDYHGVRIADPYRWLEDASTPEVEEWSVAQNAHTEAFLESSGAERSKIQARLEVLTNYPRYELPVEMGGGSSTRTIPVC